ncbi:MAG: DNA/RNA nuclease SfsA [Pikeienuella sp.]
MNFERPLIQGELLRRYKRFLADVELPDGRVVTAHCANPGAMTGLADQGAKVWLEPNDDPKRKLKFSWKLVETETGFACVDTAAANKVVAEALAADRLPSLTGYDHIRAEVPYGTNSRVDFLLTGAGKPDCYVEVKSVTLCRGGSLAEFPDTVTKRGAKHQAELAEVAKASNRAVLLYLVMRTDCATVSIAADIDPEYAAASRKAVAMGVEIHAYATYIDAKAVQTSTQVPFR